MISLLAVAFAQDLVTYKTNTIVDEHTTPTITFQIRQSGSFGFGLDCGVKRWSVPMAPYTAGQSKTLELVGTPKGDHSCAGTVDAKMPDGSSGTLHFKLPVRKLAALDWTIRDDDFDGAARTLHTRASRAIQSAEAELIGAQGVVLARVHASLEDPLQPRFSWTNTDEVLKIVVQAKDTLGASSTLTLSPWSYRIPHEDVVFESGDSTIREAEAHKLETTWSDIQAVLDKYGSVVKIQLYVAGYTDTVGPASANLGLSRRRARSIAAWFRNRGFHGGIHYQGFGESVLAVGTGDEVDNEQNRRALYLLAAGTPRTSAAIPKSSWTAL